MSWPPPHRLDYLLSFKAIFRKEGCLSFTGDKDVVVPNHPSSSSGFQGKVSLFQAPLLVDPVNFCYWTYLVLVSVIKHCWLWVQLSEQCLPAPRSEPL